MIHSLTIEYGHSSGVEAGSKAASFRRYWNRLTPNSRARFDKAVLAAQLEAEGYSRREIAKRLDVCLRTVHRYRDRLREGIPFLDMEAA